MVEGGGGLRSPNSVFGAYILHVTRTPCTMHIMVRTIATLTSAGAPPPPRPHAHRCHAPTPSPPPYCSILTCCKPSTRVPLETKNVNGPALSMLACSPKFSTTWLQIHRCGAARGGGGTVRTELNVSVFVRSACVWDRGLYSGEGRGLPRGSCSCGVSAFLLLFAWRVPPAAVCLLLFACCCCSLPAAVVLVQLVLCCCRAAVVVTGSP